jgi:hypothetical protein
VSRGAVVGDHLAASPARSQQDSGDVPQPSQTETLLQRKEADTLANAHHIFTRPDRKGLG